MPSTQQPLSNLTRQKLAMGTGSHPVANDLCRTINRLIERVDGLEQKEPDAPAEEGGQDVGELFTLMDSLRERMTGMETLLTGANIRLDALEKFALDHVCQQVPAGPVPAEFIDPLAEEQPSTEKAADEPPVDPAEIDHGEGPAPGLQPTKKKRRPHRRT